MVSFLKTTLAVWRFFREPNFREPKFLNRAYTPSVNILGSDSVVYVQILSVDDGMGLTLRSGNRTSMGKQAEGASAEGGGAQSRESTRPAAESRPARQSRPGRHQRAEISGEKRTMAPRAKVSVSILSQWCCCTSPASHIAVSAPPPNTEAAKNGEY